MTLRAAIHAADTPLLRALLAAAFDLLYFSPRRTAMRDTTPLPPRDTLMSLYATTATYALFAVGVIHCRYVITHT